MGEPNGMSLSEKEAKEIIDLNPYGKIDREIAIRQFSVIVKGFNHLQKRSGGDSSAEVSVKKA